VQGHQERSKIMENKPKRIRKQKPIIPEVVQPPQQIEKRPVGRPTIWTEEKVLQLGEELYSWMLESGQNVWFETFLYERGDIYPQFISEMCEKYDKFSELIKKVKKLQEAKIINGALSNNLNTAMSIFLLKNHHNYKDKIDSEVEHKGITLNYLKPDNKNGN
jgi:hypothetical protein